MIHGIRDENVHYWVKGVDEDHNSSSIFNHNTIDSPVLGHFFCSVVFCCEISLFQMVFGKKGDLSICEYK